MNEVGMNKVGIPQSLQVVRKTVFAVLVVTVVSAVAVLIHLVGITTGLAIGALVVSMVLVSMALKSAPPFNWNDRMGTAVWDPTKSWASTLTSIGALLALAFSASAGLL